MKIKDLVVESNEGKNTFDPTWKTMFKNNSDFLEYFEKFDMYVNDDTHKVGEIS